MKLLVIPCLVALLYAEYSPRHRRVPGAIIKGENAEPHEFPWTVYLSIQLVEHGRRFMGCTGVLISPSIVLTAAHYVKNTSQSDSSTFRAEASVYPGSHKLPDLSRQNTTRVSRVFAVPTLPKRHGSYEFYDLGIIILPKPVRKSKTIDFIDLANRNSPMVNHLNTCFIAGFGLNESGFPKVLQKLRYEVLSRRYCQSIVTGMKPCGNARKKMTLNESDIICAQGTRRGSTAFLGDSGGPFMCQNDQGKWVLYGITSTGTKLYSRYDWINLFMKIEPIRDWLVEAINFYKN